MTLLGKLVGTELKGTDGPPEPVPQGAVPLGAWLVGLLRAYVELPYEGRSEVPDVGAVPVMGSTVPVENADVGAVPVMGATVPVENPDPEEWLYHAEEVVPLTGGFEIGRPEVHVVGLAVLVEEHPA